MSDYTELLSLATKLADRYLASSQYGIMSSFYRPTSSDNCGGIIIRSLPVV